MRVFYVHELLGGSDHEFLVNLYTRVLNRWPDEGGYKHYLSRIEGRPDTRRETVLEIGHSDEARTLGIVLREEEEGEPAPATAGAGAAAPAEAGAVLAEIEALRRQLAAAEQDEAQTALERAEAGLRRLRTEVDALHADVCLALRNIMQDRLRGR